MSKSCLQANKECTDTLLENCCGLTEWICAVRWARPHQAFGRASDTDMKNVKVSSAIPPWKPWNHDSAADDTQSGSSEKSSCGLSVDVW